MINADTYWAAYESLVRCKSELLPVNQTERLPDTPERLDGGCLLYRLPAATRSDPIGGK
jgi:hypothetical protein